MATPSGYNPFKQAPPGASRSPCPALNSLANHSYIPHDGRSIPFTQLFNAIRTVYDLSLPLALLLSVTGFVLCGRFTGKWYSPRISLDLHDLALHGRIEHDGSLGHADVLPGEHYAPTVPDSERITDMLDSGTVQLGPKGPEALSFTDLSRVRLRRDQSLIRPLDAIHSLITRGEVALIVLLLGQGQLRYVPREYIRQFFSEERLPDGWHGPQQRIGLKELNSIGSSVKEEVNRLAENEMN